MHIIEPGESVFTLSHLYAIPPQALREANRLDGSYRVRIGQALIVPASDYVGEEDGPAFIAAPVDPVKVTPLEEPEN